MTNSSILSELDASLPSLRDLELWTERRRKNKIELYFRDSGPFRRELYPKHLEFFRAGAECRERALIAANRIGKTDAGAFETTLHLTGSYPDWWAGRRFPKPIKAWACGDTNKTVREILQEKLLGRPGDYGTGMIPGDSIVHMTSKQGIAEAVDTVYVKHSTGGTSTLTLKSYQEGRESFQGAGIHLGWLDEEAPTAIYDEVVMRTMTTAGVVLLTFTPLNGLSEVVLRFLPGGKAPR